LDLNDEPDLEGVKKLYDDTFNELTAFLETGKTYKEMTSIKEFKVEVERFWERSRVWKEAWDNAVYPEEKLNRDFEKIRLNAERLLLD
jgi:hypothetical protein